MSNEPSYRTDQPYGYLPERNPFAFRKHRREVFWQITIPFLVLLVIFLAMLVLPWFGSSATVSRWGDISLIWIIIPTLLVTLVFIVITIGLIAAVVGLIRFIPPKMRQLLDLLFRLGRLVEKISDLLVEPVLKVESMRASASAAKRSTKRAICRGYRRG